MQRAPGVPPPQRREPLVGRIGAAGLLGVVVRRLRSEPGTGALVLTAIITAVLTVVLMIAVQRLNLDSLLPPRANATAAAPAPAPAPSPAR